MAPPLLFANLTIPPLQSVNAAAAGTDARQLAAAGAGQVVPLVYGEDRLGGLILNVLPTTAGGTTVAVQVLWAFASDSVNDVRWNDQALPGGVTATHYTGTQTSADTTLVSAFAAQGITYGDTLNGFAYSVFTFAASLFDGQLNFSARIRGRKLYDSRLDSTAGGTGAHRLVDSTTWTWSDCPALALADFLRSTVYGAGATVDNGTVAAVANANDALIGSPSEKRRVVGVSFAAPADVASVADALRVYAGCWLLPGVNGIKLLADADGASQATYAHDSGQIYSIEPLTLRDLGNTPTVVEVLYTDTSRIPYREGRASATLSGAGTTLPWRVSQVRLPGIKRHSQAYREAVERLNKLTLMDISTVVEVFDQGIQHDPGDIITITHPIGLTSKLMRVADVAMTALGRWRLSVVEHDAAAYSTAVVTLTTLADGSRIIGADTAVAWASILDKPPDSELINLQGPYAVAQAWNFNGSAESWTASGATLAAGGLALLVTSTGTDPQLMSPAVSINGAGFYQVRARIKRAAGTGWEGTLYYSTAGHSFSASYRKTVADTTVTGQWVVVEWDMLDLTAGGSGNSSDWINSTITGLRLDLGATAADVFDIDWIGVGTTGPASYGAEWGKNVIGAAAVDAAISTAQSTATTAQSTATAAGSAAAAAQTSANTANTAIASITSDNVLSKGEKGSVILQWTAIEQEQAGIDAQATAYGITTQKTEYDTAISTLATYLGSLSPAWNDVAQDTTIVGTTFRANFAAVYAKRQALLDQIAALARSLANAAQATANTASTNATAAQSLLATMRSNGYIDAAEKPALMREWGYIVGEYSPLSTQASAYGITTEKTAYDNAYTALSTYLSGLSPSWTDTTTDTPVTPAVDQAKWTDYYNARGTLTQRIAEEAGKRSIWSGTTGRPTNLASLVGTESLLNNENSIIRSPGGGVFVSTAATQTGCLRIRLPQYFTDTMMRFMVDIFEYGAGLSCSIEIAGYTNSSTPNWLQVTARVVGDATVEYPVRFGHDGTRACVWIGNAGDTWAYPQVRVRDWFGGFSNYSAAQWESGWAVTFEPAGTFNVTATVLDTLPGADLTKGRGTVATGQIAAGAATAISIDEYDFAGGSFGTTTARTYSVTPAVDCWIEFTARLEAATIDGDSGKNVGWWVVPSGGSAVALGGSSTPGTQKKEVTCVNAFAATGGVALSFEIRTSNGGSSPNPILYKSFMRVTQIKR